MVHVYHGTRYGTMVWYSSTTGYNTIFWYHSGIDIISKTCVYVPLRQSRRRGTPTSPTLSHSLCGDWRLHQQAGPPLPGHPTGVPGVPPRRRLSDPGVLQARDFRGPSPQDVALRGVMQALVRIQAYMLADIVVAIPAVDLAIEAVV